MTADTLSHAVSTVSLALIRSRETAPPRLG
jgi:hypothetical protein